MRFADLDGTPIDVYQQNTNINDEVTASFTADRRAARQCGRPAGLLRRVRRQHPHRRSGPAGRVPRPIVAAAQARGVPVISYKQMLDWTDGRNNSTIRGLAGAPGRSLSPPPSEPAPTAQTMLPAQGPAARCSDHAQRRPVAFTVQTIKGIQYAFFTASATYQATIPSWNRP